MSLPGISARQSREFYMPDIQVENEKVAFERSFYQAFSKFPKQVLFREIWNWDDPNERVSLKLETDDTLIFCWKNEAGDPLFYVAGNSGNKNYRQFRSFGFEAPEVPGRHAEVIVLFATPYFDGNLPRLAKQFLIPFCYSYIKSRGFDRLLATCAPSLLSLYSRWGWELLDTNIIRGETRHFLMYEL